jgi:hypothetical protein
VIYILVGLQCLGAAMMFGLQLIDDPCPAQAVWELGDGHKDEPSW